MFSVEPKHFIKICFNQKKFAFDLKENVFWKKEIIIHVNIDNKNLFNEHGIKHFEVQLWTKEIKMDVFKIIYLIIEVFKTKSKSIKILQSNFLIVLYPYIIIFFLNHKYYNCTLTPAVAVGFRTLWLIRL